MRQQPLLAWLFISASLVLVPWSTERLGIPVETDWTGFRRRSRSSSRRHASKPHGSGAPNSSSTMTGPSSATGAGKDRPRGGKAEIGYAVAPARQRRGIATGVVRELVEQARRAGLRAVVAHTLAEANASTKVLERCGFRRTAELTDPDEGPIWRWERELRH